MRVEFEKGWTSTRARAVVWNEPKIEALKVKYRFSQAQIDSNASEDSNESEDVVETESRETG